MQDQASVAKNVAKRLNISTATLYEYVNGDGSPKELATKLLIKVCIKSPLANNYKIKRYY